MTASLVHRGPDASGAWYDESAGIALGHRRLSILDLSEAGAQPMHSRCGRFVTAFNGEIYNHLELRERLAAEGMAPQWRGHSDTETLLAAIAAWGLDATLERSSGMFAIALWDRERRRLSLARDRMGEKPLYWGWAGEDIVFASELKALRAHPGFRPDLDRDAVFWEAEVCVAEQLRPLGHVHAPVVPPAGVLEIAVVRTLIQPLGNAAG